MGDIMNAIIARAIVTELLWPYYELLLDEFLKLLGYELPL